MKPHAYWVLPIIVGLGGCATGFDRGALQASLEEQRFKPTESKNDNTLALPRPLSFPCRIAVYLKPASEKWRWTTDDKEAMSTWAAKLKQDGIASDVILLPEMIVDNKSLEAIQLAATKVGADAVFIVEGAAQVDDYMNVASVFNLTVVGGFIVPGSNRDALFMMEGCLFDVENDFVYAAVQSEGTGRIVRPTFIIEEKDAIAKARIQAIERFGPVLLDRMTSLASARDRRFGTDILLQQPAGPNDPAVPVGN